MSGRPTKLSTYLWSKYGRSVNNFDDIVSLMLHENIDLLVISILRYLKRNKIDFDYTFAKEKFWFQWFFKLIKHLINAKQ